MWLRLSLCLLGFALPAVQAAPLLATLAQVRTHVITTRDLQIHLLVEKSLGVRQEEMTDLLPLDRLIREWLLFLEAKSFYSSSVSATEVNESLIALQAKLRGHPEVKKWAVEPSELREKLNRRLEAQRLYSFKKKASVLPVTLAELEAEYTQNRAQYGEATFNEVKEEIRRRKSEENLRERLRQWFLVLADKYKVQKFSGDLRSGGP